MTGTGRYAECARAILTAQTGGPARGTDVGTAFLLPRTPPGPASPLARHRVQPGDRLDLIAFRYLGDPGAGWLICDANGALDPEDLIGPDAAGSTLIVPLPQPGV